MLGHFLVNSLMLAAMPSWWQAILLGFIQGATEFLPISSIAHLRIIPTFLGWPDFGVSFSAVIQLGSLGALLWYFRQDMRHVGQGCRQAVRKRQWQSESARLLVVLVVGTLPLVLAGWLVKATVGSPPRGLPVIATALIGLGLLLEWAERVGSRRRGMADICVWDGFWVGCAQMLALIPGVSRSGATLTAGLLVVGFPFCWVSPPFLWPEWWSWSRKFNERLPAWSVCFGAPCRPSSFPIGPLIFC